MTEPAGPTTQDGIYYQNSVAARYLADLLSLQPSPPRETVVEVRVEAPAHVDDIVVRYADGHRDWVQAKSNLQRSGGPWAGLWQSFVRQLEDPRFEANDRLVIVLGRRGSLADDLQALTERSLTAESEQEWRSRLTVGGTKSLEAVAACVPRDTDLFSLFRKVDLSVTTLAEIETDFQRLNLGTAMAVPRQLLSFLRDLVGNQSRLRGVFHAPTLRRRLAEDFGADLFEPREWGLPAYRDAVQRLTRIEIPGRGLSARVEDLFVWPSANRMGVSCERDFEDEMPRWDVVEKIGKVDLSKFPSDGLSRCVIVAGPGFGKSTLIAAVAAKLAKTPIVPVEVSLGSFALTDHGVIEYLEGRVNRDFVVRVDWNLLAEQGLICVLFDGLDEVPTNERAKLIKRVSLFSARFPNVPWMLTVRDPAALNGPIEAELIELEPLNNPEISEFVSKFKTWAPGLNEWSFTNDLQAYPDIARFARIPLFLSIMLASWSPQATLPRKRTDLVENYLRTLLGPNRGEGSGIPGTELRTIAQAMAFSSLEREEIGLSERQALQVVAKYSDSPRELVLQQLVACGFLRRRVDGRLEFPYPIVQEYLAAIHLVDSLPDQVAARIGDVVKRPWAQVLQFALELVPDPSPLVRTMLGAPDDVFSTGLRLIGRCVANGVAVNAQLYHEIGAELANLWGSTASYKTRERVGRLVVDGFSNPLHSEVQRRLGWRWLLGSGVDEIVARVKQPAFTKVVVDGLLEGRLDRFFSLREIKAHLQEIAPYVVSKVIERATRQGTTPEEHEGLAEFIEAVRLDVEHSRLALILAENVELPLVLRFAAYAAMPHPPGAPVLDLAKAALSDERWLNQSASLQIFARAEDPVSVLGDLLTGETVTPAGREYLLRSLGRVLPDKDRRIRAVGDLLKVPNLPHRSQEVLKVYAIRAGDRGAFIEMVEALDCLETDIACAVLVSMNFFPEKSLGDLACAKVQERSIKPYEVSRFISSATTGLSYVIEGSGWDAFALQPAPAHPSTQTWEPAFDALLSIGGLTRVQRLRAILPLLKIRSDLISEVRSILLTASEPDAEEWDEDEGGHTLRWAMDEVRRYQIPIPLELAEKFALAERPNLSLAGIVAIETIATPEALERLISIHGRIDPDERASVLDAIEVVASRLNIRISGEDLTARELR